jgi:spermidine/putrescine transport system ATP-binding protein
MPKRRASVLGVRVLNAAQSAREPHLATAVVDESRQIAGRARGGERIADVRIDGVTKVFGPVTAVDQMTLEIASGEFYSLLGPSGCGKTTTLRMIAGFEQPTQGEIFLAGMPVAGVPPYRRNVNTVFQHYALFPHMDVAQNVGYGLRQRGAPKAEETRRVAEALDLVRLSGYGTRRTWELSGGQQQRVAIARALISRPTVLFADEPTGNLDSRSGREIMALLDALNARGVTIVLVTHEEEIARHARRVVVLRDGLVVSDTAGALRA